MPHISPRKDIAPKWQKRSGCVFGYAVVIDIDKSKLPGVRTVNGWSSEQLVSASRHDQKNPLFNPSLRQLLHVSFKVVAKLGDRYFAALKKHEAVIAKNVTENLFERHMKPLLLGEKEKTATVRKVQLEAVPA
jgi:hypothetical protein